MKHSILTVAMLMSVVCLRSHGARIQGELTKVDLKGLSVTAVSYNVAEGKSTVNLSEWTVIPLPPNPPMPIPTVIPEPTPKPNPSREKQYTFDLDMKDASDLVLYQFFLAEKNHGANEVAITLAAQGKIQSVASLGHSPILGLEIPKK